MRRSRTVAPTTTAAAANRNSQKSPPPPFPPRPRAIKREYTEPRSQRKTRRAIRATRVAGAAPALSLRSASPTVPRRPRRCGAERFLHRPRAAARLAPAAGLALSVHIALVALAVPAPRRLVEALAASAWHSFAVNACVVGTAPPPPPTRGSAGVRRSGASSCPWVTPPRRSRRPGASAASWKRWRRRGAKHRGRGRQRLRRVRRSRRA